MNTPGGRNKDHSSESMHSHDKRLLGILSFKREFSFLSLQSLLVNQAPGASHGDKFSQLEDLQLRLR